MAVLTARRALLLPAALMLAGSAAGCAGTMAAAVARRSAAWRVVGPGPAVRKLGLGSVAGVSADDVWAVGRAGARHPLLIRWNGSAWSRIRITPVVQDAGLLLAAVSASDVWVVENESPGLGSRSAILLLRWNGRRWSRFAPRVLSGSANLQAVTAVSARDVWAVGTTSTRTSGPRPLIVHWDGSSWQVVPSPRLCHSGLDAVSAASARDVWAVGSFVCTHGHVGSGVFAEHWNGTSWKVVAVPSHIHSSTGQLLAGQLLAVSALSARAVWVAGYAVGRTGDHYTLLLRWNGRAWQDGPRHPGQLSLVAGTSARDVWAIGSRHVKAGFRCLFLHWNGTAWSRQPSPVPINCGASSVSASSAGNVWISIHSGPAGPPYLETHSLVLQAIPTAHSRARHQ